MTYLADRVKDVTTTIGTGPVTLAGTPPTGFVTFAVGLLGLSCLTNYAIVGATGEWEAGEGMFDGTTGLTRDNVSGSSNGGALVNFSAGSKDVFISLTSDSILQMSQALAIYQSGPPV